MADVFEGYERQYCEISASLARKCTAASALQGEKLKQKASEIKSGIDGAEALIKKMDLEARNQQPSVRAGLLAKLREYKSDLNNLKGTLKRVTTGNAQQGSREELLESGMAETLGVSADQKSRLLRITEKQNKTTDRIRDSHRTMLETEDLGVSLLQDLHQQRERLIHAHGTLDNVDDNIGKSRRIMGAMVRRMDRNKWIIGFIIALLVLVILVILYFKLLVATEHTIDMIRDSKRTMLETEDIGVFLLQDLHQQRGRLIHAHDILHNVDDNIGKSRRIIGAMVRRMDRNKWIIGFIIALLVLAILHARFGLGIIGMSLEDHGCQFLAGNMVKPSDWRLVLTAVHVLDEKVQEGLSVAPHSTGHVWRCREPLEDEERDLDTWFSIRSRSVEKMTWPQSTSRSSSGSSVAHLKNSRMKQPSSKGVFG
uniref:Vesicle transport v-SNARE N-terminal domain-containing protein n=1 Tax=Oryza rufipogon TaxID=4529 RepID=A0A0E0MY37_ORYRU